MPKRLSARERLAQHMDDRRLDLDLRWADVATAAAVTTETLRQVRAGDGEIRPLTKRGIEHALLWAPGSVNKILAGGEPTTLEDSMDVKIRNELSPSTDLRLRRQLFDSIAALDEEDLPRALKALTDLINKRSQRKG